ncbi:MAG: lysine--tRNA ligase [Alphaproteobacteria bacterium]
MLPKHYNHWADQVAKRVIAQKGDKELYTVASGITPSGLVHFGNFRETITVWLVARALRDRGKKVRFIYSWDDYDTFRKVPKNMPKQEMLKEMLFQSVVDIPDPYEKEDSYALMGERPFEKEILEKMQMEVDFIYQHKMYRDGKYKKEIKTALENEDKIRKILNEYRSSPLSKDWSPALIYCEKCNRDKTIIKEYKDGKLSYECSLCDHKGIEDLETTSRTSLRWRIDWPMRWNYENVDFEPGGKDHSTQGGSRTTGETIIKEIWKTEPPVYQQYDFIGIKGGAGKISSSSGNGISVSDVLNVYSSEMIRWIFASYKPNKDFNVSFDLDVLTTYEAFDRQERIVFEEEKVGEKKFFYNKRIYELSFPTLEKVPTKKIFRPAFRHLCNFLQINGLDIEATKKHYINEIKNKNDENSFLERAEKAKYWIENYAPAEFKFMLHSVENAKIDSLNNAEKKLIKSLIEYLENEKKLDEKELKNFFYAKIPELEIDAKEFYQKLYMLLIGKNHGPKIAMFLVNIGAEKVLPLLKKNI